MSRGPLLLAPSALLWLSGVLAPLLFLIRLSLFAPAAATGERRYDTLFYQAGTWSLGNFTEVLTQPYYLRLFGFTALLAAAVTVLTLVFGYVLAYAVYRAATPGRKVAWILCIALPKFTNILVFVFGVKLIFGASSLAAVIAGEVLLLTPYAALTMAAALENVPYELVETARGLGASARLAFLRVTLPLSLPGVAAAGALTLAWSLSAFLGPYLLGGPAQYTVAVEVDRQIHSDLNWSLGAALNLSLMALLGLIALVWAQARKRWL